MTENPENPVTEEEIAPLLPPTPIPMYPFRDDGEYFIEGIGDYLLTGEDYIALRDTVGLPLKKSRLKVFLIRRCNIPDPTDYSFHAITETLRFYLEEKAKEELRPARHSPDFRSVHWYGTEHFFTAIQAAIIKELWEAWENGTPDIGKAALLESVGSQSKRLVDIFKKHATYKQLIGEGSTKGTYRLIVPST